jgi:hypothetical protein
MNLRASGECFAARSIAETLEGLENYDLVIPRLSGFRVIVWQSFGEGGESSSGAKKQFWVASWAGIGPSVSHARARGGDLLELFGFIGDFYCRVADFIRLGGLPGLYPQSSALPLLSGSMYMKEVFHVSAIC